MVNKLLKKHLEQLQNDYVASEVWKCEDSLTGAHHWMISKDNGVVALGRCKYCRQSKKFYPNYNGVWK